MAELEVTREGQRVRIAVRVAPRASRAQLMGVHRGALKVALTAPPVDGAANRALIVLLAKTLGVSRAAIVIARGERSRDKQICIDGIAIESVRALLTPGED